MLTKKLFLPLFLLFFTIFLPSKVYAAEDIYYCTYRNDLTLVLPVTIGAEISILDLHNPFSPPTRYSIEQFVYNEETCNNVLGIPSNDKNNTLVGANFYYSYENNRTYIPPIGNGVFSLKDLLPPTIKSHYPIYKTNVETKLSLSEFGNFVFANDEIDGNITPEIIYDNYSENYNKIGEYSLIFKACDKSNNCSTLNQKIKVIDDISPNINGPKTINSYMSNPVLIADLILELSAIDNHDGDISHKIYVEDTNYKDSIVGSYFATFLVKDSSNNIIKTPFKIEIKVIDDIIPIIEGPTYFVSKLSSVISTKSILNNMIISDNSDKLAYQNLYIIEDNYSNNQNKIGSYLLIVATYDSFGNESLPYVIKIDVVDDVKPIIDGQTTYESYLSSPIDIYYIKSSLIVIDNYDGNLINKLEIIEDTYSNNKDKIGVYYLTFIVKDYSNNSSDSYTIQIANYDDIPPLILGDNFYKTLNTIKLDVLSIKLSLTASDNIDGDLSNNIILDTDSYSENHNKTGNYFLSFYVCDRSGNISNPFKIKISVNEDLSYLQYIDNSRIYLPANKLKNTTEIIEMLNIDTTKFNNVSIINDTYSPNFDTEGNYQITYQIENLDYTKEAFTINVITYRQQPQQETISTTKNKEKKETIFSKIVSFLKSLIFNVVNFFKNLFR